MQALKPKLLPILCSCLALLVALAIPAGHTDETDEIRAAASQGDYSTALTQLEVEIQQHPEDPELWFLKADTLHKAGAIDEAIEAYRVLIDKYPDVPEAYNNLAILYANQGDYQRAALTLQQAFQTSPEFATAFENLMSIYDKMASDAFRKALDAPASETDVELVLQDFSHDNEDTIPDNAPKADNEHPISSRVDEDISTGVTLASVESQANSGLAGQNRPSEDMSISDDKNCARDTNESSTPETVDANSSNQLPDPASESLRSGAEKPLDMRQSDCIDEDLQ